MSDEIVHGKPDRVWQVTEAVNKVYFWNKHDAERYKALRHDNSGHTVPIHVEEVDRPIDGTGHPVKVLRECPF